jgi:hypothetical protein
MSSSQNSWPGITGDLKPLGHTLQPLQIPESVACEAKENPAHAVVHANNFTLGAKKWDRPEPSLVEF